MNGRKSPKRTANPARTTRRARNAGGASPKVLAPAPAQVVGYLGGGRSGSFMERVGCAIKTVRRNFTRDVICHVMGAAIGLGVVFPALYMLLDRRPVLKYDNQRILPNPVMRGERAAVAYDVVEYRQCHGYFQRVVIDSSGHTFSFDKETTTYRELSHPPRMRTIQREFVVPRGAAMGDATYRIYITRWCNLMQKYLWPMTDTTVDIKFTIIDRPGAS